MNNNSFILYTEIIKFNKYLRKYVSVSIPAVHRDLKIHLMDENYNLIKYMYTAIYNKGNIRIKYITEMIITISLLDNILSIIMDFCPTNKKYTLKSIDMLTKIKNMTFAWKKNPEPNNNEIRN